MPKWIAIFVLFPLAVWSFSAHAQVNVDLSVLDSLSQPSSVSSPSSSNVTPMPERKPLRGASGLTPMPDEDVPEDIVLPYTLEALKLKYSVYPFSNDILLKQEKGVAAAASAVKAVPVPSVSPEEDDVFKEPIPAPAAKPDHAVAEVVYPVPSPVVETAAAEEPAIAAVAEDEMSQDEMLEELLDEEPVTTEEPVAEAAADDAGETEIDITYPVPTIPQDQLPEPKAEEVLGLLVAGVGYNGDDIRLDPPVETALINDYIPKINAQESHRLGLYAYASSDGRGERKARRLSLSRALELRSFLIRNGVDAGRIDIFPRGDTASSGFADRVDLILQK